MKKYWILFGIVLLAAVLRFYQLGVNPPSLTWDEAAWGYNAYSIGIDGKDEFGKFLPYQYLESFGDFKPPVYAYLDVLPVKLFGLNEFAARFPSALFGTLTVLLTYFLTKAIFAKNSEFDPSTDGQNLKQMQNTNDKTSLEIRNLPAGRQGWKLAIPIVAAALLAISPWHIMLSRAAFEANVATFFLVFGAYAFLKGVQDKSYFLILSAVSFVLAINTFNSARIVGPLLVIVLVVSSFKKLWQMKPIAITAGIVGLLFLLPLIPFLLSPQSKLRYQEVNIFSDVNLVKLSNQEIANAHGAWWAKIVANRRVIYGREFLKHYFDNLSLNFLFIQGDGNPKFSLQEVGEMYIWEMPFLLLGIFFLFRYRQGKWYLLPLWLLLGIIPAAVARETPHALRIESTLPTWQVIVAYGAVESFAFIKRYRTIALGILSTAIVICLTYFLHAYYFHYATEFSGEWQYGYKDSIAYVQSVQAKYDHIVVTSSLGRPYIYYLFYLKVPPQEFRQNGIVKRDAYGFVDVTGFSKYAFPETIQPVQGKTLYILSNADKVPSRATLLKTFYLLNGGVSLRAYGT